MVDDYSSLSHLLKAPYDLKHPYNSSLFAVRVSGLFIWIDTALSWILYGVICVQMCTYVSSLNSRAGRAREGPYHICVILFIWALATAQSLSMLSRATVLNSNHFGDTSWADHFKDRPHGLIASSLGMITILTCVGSIIFRAVAFAKTIVHGTSPGIIRRISQISAVVFQFMWILAGIGSEWYRMQYDSFSELIADASETSSLYPRFITFQLVWLLLGLLTALLCTYNMWRDITHARRWNSTDHPNVKMTNEVLSEWMAAMFLNWISICVAHGVYIFAVTYKSAAIAGRGTACLPLVWVIALGRMISKPRQTRSRQLMETEVTGMDCRGMPRGMHLAGRPNKRLFGFLKKTGKRKPPPVLPTSTEATGMEVGFFSMLRVAERRSSTIVSPTAGARRRGSSLVDGIRKTIDVLTYSRREGDFHLLDVDGQKDEVELELELSTTIRSRRGEDWETKNQMLGIGNAVWVETSQTRRPLSANEHHPTPTPSPLQSTTEAFLNPFPASASSIPHRSRSRSPMKASAFGTYSLPSIPNRRDKRTPRGPQTGERRAQVTFLDSFPSGPVVSQAYGQYDPDLDTFELPSLTLPTPHLVVSDTPSA